uniref:Uncharacterized protein n=1 Tax=Arundo donax TaxID=35708 RepID=A0A0A8Y9C4_ARUDO
MGDLMCCFVVFAGLIRTW